MSGVVEAKSAPSGNRKGRLAGWLLARGIVSCAALMYVVLLQLVYVLSISPDFSYAGYTTRNLPIVVVVLATFIASAPALWLPLRLSRPSQLLYWILYAVAFVPSVLVPFYALSSPILVVLTFALALLLAFASFAIIYVLPHLRIVRIPITPWAFWLGVALLTMAAGGQIVAAFGLPTALPALSDIYEVREEYAAGLEAGGRRVGLAITWLVNVVGPLLIAVGLVRQRWLVLALGILIELTVFATTGFKSSLLAPVAIVLLYLAIRFGARAFGALVGLGMSVLILASVLLDAVFQQLYLVSWLVRRFLVTPGLAAGRFYEFFSENRFAYLGHSILEGVVDRPYSLTPPYLIGNAYEGRMFSANANIWADGFANFGIPGMLVASLILAAVAYLFDSLVHGRKPREKLIVALLLILPGITFSNSALLTSLVTHGVLMVLVVVLTMPAEPWTIRPKQGATLMRFLFGPRPDVRSGA